jgi:hypothetical protein
MKKYVLLSFSFLTSIFLLAQTPSSINYQAAARDNSGNVLVNQSVSFRLTILQGSIAGTSVYQETHAVTTNGLGLVNFGIGAGVVNLGAFQGINWANGPYYLQVELAIGTGAFQQMGTSQFVSVPYALYAAKSGNKVYPGNGITISNDSIQSVWTKTGADVQSNNTGNVGVGMSPANQKLEVNGGLKISNTTNNTPGSVRYSAGGDFEGATATGWKSLTKTAVNYYELSSFHQVSSTLRDKMVLSVDSLIVPETANYLIIYTGIGANNNAYNNNSNMFDGGGETGVVNVSNNLNWLGQTYGFMYSTYQGYTPAGGFHEYTNLSYTVSTYASLTAGNVLKAGAVVLAGGSAAPTTSWYFTPHRIQLIKLN